MLFAEALETAKCFDEGVLSRRPTPTSARSWASASRRGPVAPRSTSSATRGGTGKGFVARAEELAAKYGDRFLPPASLT